MPILNRHIIQNFKLQIVESISKKIPYRLNKRQALLEFQN